MKHISLHTYILFAKLLLFCIHIPIVDTSAVIPSDDLCFYYIPNEYI